MLGRNYRITTRNDTGAGVSAFSVFGDKYTYVNGEPAYLAQTTFIDNIAPANGAVNSGPAQDNSVDKAFGIKFTAIATGSGTGGNLEIFMEWSDELGNFPSDAGGAVVEEDLIQIGAINFDGSQVRSINFTYE